MTRYIALLLLACNTQAQSKVAKMEAVGFSHVQITDAFWSPRIDKVTSVTIPVCIQQTEVKTPRIRNFEKVARKKGEKHEGIYFDDSDVYKALEAIAYSLKNHPDKALEQRADEWIDKIAAAQQPDGYLNTFYTLNGLDQRWTDMEKHEDYCAGHLIEAAVAYYNTTGKRRLLDVATRLADHIDSTFRGQGRHWVSGHEEIELSLVKLYKTTGKEKYLDLAQWYIEQRGHGYGKGVIWDKWKDPKYCQDDVPVRDQKEIEGHAVRAMYLYTGAADVGAAKNDSGYMNAMKQVWEDVVYRNMYITGGIGSSGKNEGFSMDYDLPNHEAYCETCASVGMVLWNQRMNLLTGDAKYIDVLERSLYNGALDGLSLSGDRFFYGNPLASVGNYGRSEWFGTACCPSNIARLVESLGNYIYAASDNAVWVNLFVGSNTKVTLQKGDVRIAQETQYPWNGAVRITLTPAAPMTFPLHIRIPGWAQNKPVPGDTYRFTDRSDSTISLTLNGKPLKYAVENGYAVITGKWKKEDVISLNLPMPVRRVIATDSVKADRGRVAIQRGPLVYCVEQPDNKKRTTSLILPEDATFRSTFESNTLGGIVVIRTAGSVEPITAIPYFSWANRGNAEMQVWLPVETTYLNNRAPLRPNPYIQLPLGAIRPRGWLKEMLVSQKDGATGQLDKLYPLVMDQRNGWLGGDGDQWERGPYWIDGLVPLAYILDDTALIAKAKPWIEWAIKSQQPDGYFGPSKDYTSEPGLQRDNSHDWWPKIVMLKVLQQYYQATADPRVIKLMTGYFRYQLKELPSKPLDHWSFWARYRAGDNLMVVYWLYNITGDAFLLSLGDLLHRQTFDFTEAFLHTSLLSTMGSIHGVNLAQGMKEPLIYYQQHPEQKYLQATAKGFEDLRKYDGFANGMFGGDESLHGNNPTQGAELCTAVEMMFTLEQILDITGDVSYADQLEKIAFNALPSQINDRFTQRQYFQQANQVMLTRHTRNFDVNHHGTDLCFGLLTGYPCCTSNMHQGWPKFTQNLWYATPDKGLAALVYSPSEVKAYVAGNEEVTIKEETNYPFSESIKFIFTIPGKKTLSFPFRLRIPQWCDSAAISINGTPTQTSKGGSIVTIHHAWSTGDVLELVLPMKIFSNTWYENSLSVERGPLTYALKIGDTTKNVVNEKDATDYGTTYEEVTPTTPWNYALIRPRKNVQAFTIVKKGPSADPWHNGNPAVTIKAKARRIPSWQLYNEMTGPIPYSMTYQLETGEEEEITLIPYGCTRLRISQFPVVGN